MHIWSLRPSKVPLNSYILSWYNSISSSNYDVDIFQVQLASKVLFAYIFYRLTSLFKYEQKYISYKLTRIYILVKLASTSLWWKMVYFIKSFFEHLPIVTRSLSQNLSQNDGLIITPVRLKWSLGARANNLTSKTFDWFAFS
jgi:hypothetical protein